MQVTPQQATTTRCPMKLNNKDLTTQEANCLGTACMAWRWDDDGWQCGKCQAVFTTADTCPDCGSQVYVVRSGYCGLADKPQVIAG